MIDVSDYRRQSSPRTERWYVRDRSVTFDLANVFMLVIGDCPSVYRMMDPDHSYCAKKVSVQSLPPASADIKLILDMHNEERSNVASKDMQKMVSFVEILNRPIERVVIDIFSTGIVI